MSAKARDLVLVTGGAGTLGRAIAPALLDAGFAVRTIDIRPIAGLPTVVEVATVDLRDRAAVHAAMDGVTAVIHGAAWHGMHLRDHSTTEFWDLNVGGSFNVYEAALEAGVRAVVLSSTMGVYGDSGRPTEGGPAVRVHEDLPTSPGDIYGESKILCEELSRYYARRGVAGAALRYGMFVPESFLHSGIRFLYGGVDERDVAAANILALRRLLAEGGHLGAFNIMSALPFDEADGQDLRDDPPAAISRHWPDGPALLARAGVKPWGPIDQLYEIDHGRVVLGWEPQWGFDQFLRALRDGRGAL